MYDKKNMDYSLMDLYNKRIHICNKNIKKIKDQLYEELKHTKSKNIIRELNKDLLSEKDIISVFESTLTRIIGMEIDELSEDIIVVQTYYFDVLEDIIHNGFIFNNEKYVVYTASAGQIRTKKTVFIKESVLKKHSNSLMCGLTVDDINRQGGVNINKYLAYLALTNSATDLWEDFDINKSIVVDDMETQVTGLVDFIDDKTYEITRKEMKVPIEHTDGCGMILPRKSKKSFMVRLPWVKGLLVPFSFDKYIRECKSKYLDKKVGIIKDIYGKEHDLLKEDIEVIFTKSQFKMWKFYKNWESYKENFLRYNCQAGTCNMEEDYFNEAKINYQMIQTLTDMTDEEINNIATKTKNNIKNIGRDKDTMLKVLGATKTNTNKNYLQKALTIYPELLQDTYTKEVLKQVKKSLVKEGKSAKLDIEGMYSFIIPDLYAFCEWLISKDENPNGLLKNGEVYCSLYKNGVKLDCLRSPHLYREHAVRKNVIDKEKKRWFITKGVYTSVHDLISKMLQFDNDGDKSLVCADKILVKVAERNMENIVPLYYNMAKAGAEIISNKTIYIGLKTAYTGGNIGMISNDITKIWNSENVDLDVVKILCMENNFVIDYAKTLYKPKRPPRVKKIISKYTNKKVPRFFVYAKDKKKRNVEKINNSVVNKLEKIIPNTRINFNAANLGKFNYEMLMNDKNIKIDNAIIEKYTELDLKKRFIEINNLEDDTSDNLYMYKNIREKLLKVNSNVYYVADVLIKYLYEHKKSSYKTTLWSCFGDVIVENLQSNITKPLDDGYIQCEICGERVEDVMNNRKYCNKCGKDIDRRKSRERMKRKRSVRKSQTL